MRILHISGAQSWGGNEQQLIDTIVSLNRLNIESFVWGVAGSPLEKECIAYNIPFLHAKKKKLNTIANYYYLKQIVSNHQPDIIHLHTSDSLTVFTISDLLFKLNTKCVFSKKGMGSSSSFISKFKYNYKHINVIACISKSVSTEFSESTLNKKSRTKLVTIYDGININRLKAQRIEKIRQLYNIDKHTIILGHIANHSKAKDIETLIRAIDYLVNTLNFKNVKLLQIGSFSKLTQSYKDLVKSCHLEDYFIFCGFEERASDFMAQFDIYVMSSKREGLSMSICEALYKKVPIVSTRGGGIPEAVIDGFSGLLANVGDYSSLAKQILHMIENPQIQDECRTNGYDHFMKNFSSDITELQWKNTYKNLIMK